jgi:ATP-dependent helicase/nuclease subunit B
MRSELTLLLGRAGTGKTEWISRRLKALQDAGGRAVLLVPEQYTYEAERALAKEIGGLLGVQVFSFQRLCERVLQLHGQTKPFLSAQGYRMVVRRALDRKKGELKVFGEACAQTGFAAEAQEIFRDLKRAGITPDALDALVHKLPDGSPLAEKLRDISILYRETETYLSERYFSVDDAPNAAADLLAKSFVSGLPVFIDGLDHPNRQTYRLVETMLCCCKSVTVSLRIDEGNPPDGDLFEPDRKALFVLRRIGERCGAVVREEQLSKQPGACSPLMRHIERNLFAYPAKIWREGAGELTVFGASDRRAEAESLAEAILKLAQKGVRYRDMAVIVSDLDAYAYLIRRSCERRNIPIFLDRKRPLTGHAAIDAALSAVRFAAGGYPAAELLRFIKSGYTDCPQDDAEELELYLRRTGMRGGGLLKPFTRAEPSEGAEHARALAAERLGPLAKTLAKATVSEQVRALYAFLQKMELQRRLEERAGQLEKAGRIAEAQEHAQVWNLLIELLDQLDAILGSLRVGRRGFLALLEEGLSGGSVGVVPGTADQGLVGDVVRTRSRTVRALFVVGANDGLLPRPQQNDGLIDERELTALREQGAELRFAGAELSAYDRLDLYTALAKATESLYISFSYGDGSGELSPSPIVERLKEICPNCSIKSDIESTDELPDCEAQALTLVAGDLRHYRETGAVQGRLPALIDYLSEKGETRERVARMVHESLNPFGSCAIGEEIASTLYGKTVPMSASRLESFNNCPFQHFIRYGLGAQEVRDYTERAIDLGAFYHAALEAFVNAVNSKRLEWKRLTDETVLLMIDEVLPGVIAGHNFGILTENERLKATLFLLIETVRQSALAIAGQIRAGSFTPALTEAHFGPGQPFPAIRLVLEDGSEALVNGKIDRIDRANTQGRVLSRVIDYKTGGRDFDFTGVLEGLTLQLPLYVLAASGNAEVRAGMYYMPVSQPAVSDAEEDIEGAVADAFRLRGLTLSDAAVIRASDNHIEEESSVLYKVRAAGEEDYSGSVCSKTEMDMLIRAAKQTSERTFARMMEGEMRASPAARKKNRPACEYCAYNSVCRFDPKTPGCTVRRYHTVKQDAFFKLIGGDADAMDE